MATRPPLVLHVDINKTIIVCDPVKGVDMEGMVNSLLSEACWGAGAVSEAPSGEEAPLKKRRVAESWRFELGPSVEPQPGLTTYADMLEGTLKLPKKEYTTLKTTFTERGQPGEKARGAYDELQRLLRLPDGVSLPCAPPAVGPGRWFVLPSFFNMLLHLEKEGRDFRIVFRTFGVDMPHVIREFNLFCSGGHPCYPDVPSSLRQRCVDMPRGTGEWYRDASGVHLALSQSSEGADLVQNVHGTVKCAEALRRKLFGPEPALSLALRDYFEHWRGSGESDDSGKPLLVEPPAEGAAHHIFFDDNIERDRAHIVDARDAATGEAIPFAETRGVFLIRAEPLEAIRNPSYFVEAIAAAEAALAGRRAAS